MSEFIQVLSEEFQRSADPENAVGQKAYMRNQFEFFGIKAPIRKDIQKPFLVKTYLPPKEELEGLVKELWNKPEREFQMFGQELTAKYQRQFGEKDIELLEFMVVNKSWWDTVDFIASHLMGSFFKIFPELRQQYVDKWLDSNNIWLQRCALLFQLKYREQVDTELLVYIINRLLGSKEFFINKAIGWILREYSKRNPNWVMEFVNETDLHSLSRKEALKAINRKKG